MNEVIGWAGAYGPDGGPDGETFLTVVFPAETSETERLQVSRELLHSIMQRFCPPGDILEGGFSPVLEASGPPFREAVVDENRMRKLLNGGYAYAVVVFKTNDHSPRLT